MTQASTPTGIVLSLGFRPKKWAQMIQWYAERLETARVAEVTRRIRKHGGRCADVRTQRPIWASKRRERGLRHKLTYRSDVMGGNVVFSFLPKVVRATSRASNVANLSTANHSIHQLGACMHSKSEYNNGILLALTFNSNNYSAIYTTLKTVRCNRTTVQGVHVQACTCPKQMPTMRLVVDPKI